MQPDHDILIVGGGLSGALMALALAGPGFRVGLVDATEPEVHADPAFDGRSYALALGSVRMLSALGLWQDLEPKAQPITGIRASDGRPGEGAAPWHLSFDGAELEEGPMGHILEDRWLRAALLSAVATQPGIAHLTAREVTAQAAEGPLMRLDFADGAARTARLVVGADGRGSGTARRAGLRRTGWDYGQRALVAAIAHERPHGGVAHQLFLPAGPLAILPLPGDRSSIVWSETRRDAARIEAMDDAAFLDHLRPRFGDFRGRIALAGRRYSYPLGLSLTSDLVAPRVALVGDAAHGLHPIAGQGLNLGIRDVATLAEVLTEARRRGEDIGTDAVLARYRRWRRFDIAALAVATDGFNRLFSNDNPLLRAVRDAGMGVVDALPGVKRAFMREAAGLSGDLPRLMTGRPL